MNVVLFLNQLLFYKSRRGVKQVCNSKSKYTTSLVIVLCNIVSSDLFLNIIY